MRIRTKTILILSVLLSAFSVNAQKEFMLTGKIVDAQGKPAIADILVPCGDLAFTAKSDANGTFEVTYSNVCEEAMLVTAAVDAEKFYLPFYHSNLPPEYYKKKYYVSLGEIDAKGQEKVDLGRIPVQVYFGAVVISIDKKDARKVFDSEGGIFLRIRDKRGNLINENPIDKGLNKEEHSINIALPYGTYRLEVKNSNFDWQPVGETITIAENAPVNLNFAPKKEAAMTAPKFRKLLELGKTAARRELKNRGLALTNDEFKAALNNGNIEATIIYLKAGMSPNVRFEHGFTPLMQAAKYPEIIEFLLANGANVNAQTDNFTLPEGEEGEALGETTPLMIAVYEGNADAVRIMLEHGALPDIVNALGDTALRIAVINGKTELVGELLKFGANPKTKDRDGRLLLDVAKEYGHQSIVELMEKSPKN